MGASYEDKNHRHSVYLRRVDGDFTNPSFRGAGHELSSLKSGFESRLDAAAGLGFEADGFVHRFDRTGEQKERLLAVIKHDVMRLDRLISDISDASRLDAELAREAVDPVDIARLLETVVAMTRGRIPCIATGTLTTGSAASADSVMVSAEPDSFSAGSVIA